MTKNTKIIFQSYEVVGNPIYNGPKKRIRVGVYVDVDELAHLILKAAKNKGRKAKDGALYVEVHSIVEVQA